MAFDKITADDTNGKGVVGLPDTPQLDTTSMQKKFDELATDVIIPKFNKLVDDLNGEEGASFTGVKVPDGLKADSNLQSVIQALHDDTQTRQPKEEGKGLSANDYTNEEKEKVKQNTDKRHSHVNKNVLDAIVGTVKAGYDRIVTLFSNIQSVSGVVEESENSLPTGKAVATYVKAAEKALSNAMDTFSKNIQESLTIITNAVNTKQPKEEGKGLSTNDYTNEEKEKVKQNTDKRHSHVNKNVLDAITDTVKSGYDNLITLFAPIKRITKEIESNDESIPTGQAIVNFVQDLGGGDMISAKYDPDKDGKVLKAEQADNATRLDGQPAGYYKPYLKDGKMYFHGGTGDSIYDDEFFKALIKENMPSMVDSSLKQEGKAADAKATGDALSAVNANIPDDAILGDKPWTFKHIIDMLCPPLEESGNPVVCYPVAGYPLGVKAKWEPMQEGSGTPSPENIRPIHGRDSVTVERCKKNLLNIKPFNKGTNNGITYEYVSDGGIHISGTALANSDSPTFPVWHLPPGKYYGLNLGEGTIDSLVVNRNGVNYWISVKNTFEILAGDICRYWYTLIRSGTTIDKTVYPYIVPGTTAPTTYTPYIGQTNTLSLPETIYGGTVDAVSGSGERAWRMLALDGTENWHTWGVNANNAAVTGFFTYDIGDYKAENGNCICSHLPHDPNSDIWGGRNEGVGLAGSGKSRYLMCCVKTKGLDDVSSDAIAITSWKAYLAAQYAAGTPVQVAYELATPIHFQADGGSTMPALSGINTILTDVDSVDVTGRADPIKRITDLEDAVASMTTT